MDAGAGLLHRLTSYAPDRDWDSPVDDPRVRHDLISNDMATVPPFMKRYPASGYGPTALFWLGTAQYALHNYRDAKGNFGAMVTAEPDHPHAPEALLSIADCQIELMDVKSARKTFEDVVDAYPESEAAVVAKERLASLR